MIDLPDPKYSSVSKLCRVHHLSPRLFENWRLLPAQLGCIPSLPQSYGISLATDGIMMLVLRPTGQVEQYHYDYWQVEKSETPRQQNRNLSSKLQAYA